MATTTVTAKDIQELRQRTGAGMMDCKKALEESAGDIEKAIEYLRKKGIAKAEKRAGRAASEGRIIGLVSPDGKSGALIELNSETDFVSRNEAFGAVAQAVADQVLADTSIDGITANAAEGALMKQPWQKESSKTVEEAVKEASARTGENVVLRRYARFTTDGVIGTYVHHNGKVAVLVDVAGGSGEVAARLARTIAEHIAAGVPKVPLAVTREQVPADVVERERRIFDEQARGSGKPENMIGKIVDGQINKFYKENTLLDQQWVRDESGSVTIQKLVSDASKESGAPLAIRRFARFQMGEE
jgi:elongation factor Ts